MTRLLVDGPGVVCRTWWASPSDVPSRFRAAIERAKPSTGAEVTVCWDGQGSWRRDIYPGYKANRGPKPQALVRALNECRGIYLGWVADGYEADDILATLALDAKNGDATIVLSDDKDLLQLSGMNRIIIIDSSCRIYGLAAHVQEKWGVPPARLRHLFSWTGDHVDGLPGVPGYGPKKAIAKALAGKIGNKTTYRLTELADVPAGLMRRVGPT